MKLRVMRLFISLLLVLAIFAGTCATTMALTEENVVIYNITLSPIEISDLNITVKGSVSATEEKEVSILVIPRVVGGNQVDSWESLLSLETPLLYGNLVYGSQKLSSAGEFEFKFVAPTEGSYIAFLSAFNAQKLEPVPFVILTFAEQLNGKAGNYDGFKSVLSAGFSNISATYASVYNHLLPEEKETVYSGMFGYLPFEDNEEVSSVADIQLQAAMASILANLKTNASDPEKIVEDIVKRPALYGAQKTAIYEEGLPETVRGNILTAISSGISECTDLESCGTLFDTSVQNAATALETSVINSINGAVTTTEFAEVFEDYKIIIGLSESEIKTFDRLSDSMLDKIYGDMIKESDTNDDGKSEFTGFTEIAGAFRTVITNIGTNDLALDIVNNRANGDKIIDILNEYSSLMPGLDITGYEALTEAGGMNYKKYVVDGFLNGNADASLTDVKNRFNNLVDAAERLGTFLATINSADYSAMVSFLTDENLTLMNVSSDAKEDYDYIKKESTSEYTNFINELVKYVPYSTLDSFTSKFASVAQTIMSRIEGSNNNNNNNNNGGGGGGGNKSYVVKDNSSSTSVSQESNVMFSDIDEVSWAKNQIIYLAQKGIINGVGDKRFSPSTPVKREEFIKILVGAYGIYNSNADCSFKDVSEEAWYYKYVASAYEAGLVTGYDSETFGIGKQITREEMAVLIYRAQTKLKAMQVNEESQVNFVDDEHISEYAKEGVYALKSAGYVKGTGDNMFNPKNMCTRAEAAVMIYNVLN